MALSLQLTFYSLLHAQETLGKECPEEIIRGRGRKTDSADQPHRWRRFVHKEKCCERPAQESSTQESFSNW